MGRTQDFLQGPKEEKAVEEKVGLTKVPLCLLKFCHCSELLCLLYVTHICHDFLSLFLTLHFSLNPHFFYLFTAISLLISAAWFCFVARAFLFNYNHFATCKSISCCCFSFNFLHSPCHFNSTKFSSLIHSSFLFSSSKDACMAFSMSSFSCWN